MKTIMTVPPRRLSGILFLLLAGLCAPDSPRARAANVNPQTVQKTVSSAEFRAAYIEGVAQKLLGRAATAEETASLSQQWASGATGWMKVVSAVAGSPAYFQKVGNTDAKFVARLFQDLVGRAPDAAEEAPAALDFLKGGGSRAELAEVVADTDEFRAGTVQDFYQKLLGRAATAAEATAGAGKLNTGGVSALVGALIASPAYFAKSGGTQNGWQNAVNRDLIGTETTGGMGDGSVFPTPILESPAPASLPTSLPVNGARAPMVQALLASPEYFTNVVQTSYQKFLRRAATPAELSQWLGALQNGGSSDQVMLTLLTSDEYFNRAGGTTTGFMNRLSQDVLGKSGGVAGKAGKPSTSEIIDLLRNLPRRKP